MLSSISEVMKLAFTSDKKLWFATSILFEVSCSSCGSIQSCRATALRAPGEEWWDGIDCELLDAVKPAAKIESCPSCGASYARE